MRHTKVTDRIYLGDVYCCREVGQGANTPTLHITSPGEEFCGMAKEAAGYLMHEDLVQWGGGDAVLGWDEFNQPLTHHMLHQCEKWAEKHDEVFIHCHAGLHRSPTVALALACVLDGMDFFDAIALVGEAMREYDISVAPQWTGADLRTVSKWLDRRW